MRKRMKSKRKEREISREGNSGNSRKSERAENERSYWARRKNNNTHVEWNEMEERANPFERSWERETSAKCSHAEDITMAMW